MTKVPLHREFFLRVSWRRGGSGGKVRGGWVEGGRADGSERYGKNLRLKLMRFHPSFSLHRLLFPLSSRLAIRMTMQVVVRDECVH